MNYNRKPVLFFPNDNIFTVIWNALKFMQKCCKSRLNKLYHFSNKLANFNKKVLVSLHFSLAHTCNYDFRAYNTRPAQHFHSPHLRTKRDKTWIRYKNTWIWKEMISKGLYIQILRLHICQACIFLFQTARYVTHDDVIKWKHFPRNWPFVREIHRSPVNFPHKGQWRGALMFSLIYAWINDWVNNREAGDLRRQHGHYDVIVMLCPPGNSQVT